MTRDILQVAMKTEKLIFNAYITPTKPIDKKATETNGLSRYQKKLFKHGKEVATRPLNIVFLNLLEYFQKIQKKCVLVAHNSPFDSRRLLYHSEQLSLTEEFNKYILGFTDTLNLFKKLLPERAGGYKLSTLASELLSTSVENAHDALVDIKLLEQLSIKYLSVEELSKVQKNTNDILNSLESTKNIKIYLPSYEPMRNILSEVMLKRLASFKISYNDLIEKYKISGEQETIKFLRGEFNGKPKIIKSKPILNKILQHLKSLEL